MPRVVLWGASFLVLGRIAVFAVGGSQGLEWDTTQLVLQSATFRACVAAGSLGSCDGAGHFPILQFLPALVLGAAGFEPSAVVRTLAAASFAAFVGLLVVGWHALPAVQGTRALWLVVIGSSPLLYYAQSSFGEALAALLVAAAVASCWSRLPSPALAALVALAGITKEFAPPIVVVLGGLAMCSGDVSRDRRMRRLAALAVGALLAVVINATFNLLRFGVPYNQILLGASMPAVPLSDRQSFFLGLWWSPNGGLAYFWASFVVVLTVVLAQRWRPQLANIPAYGVALVLTALTFGLSGWWAPFGWIAVGTEVAAPMGSGLSAPAAARVSPRGAVVALLGWCRIAWAGNTSTASTV